MNNEDLFEAFTAYDELYPNDPVLSPDSLTEKYANNDYIISVYNYCVKVKKPYKEVVPKDHFIQYPPDVEI
ncbi:MAG: hypothetical protein ACC608_02500 [Anaerofustis sp.]